jgi:hypothetical protein
MTPWIFDNVGDTTPEAIKAQIEKSGGKIEGEPKKLDKGGVAFDVERATATATMSKMADWCAERKIRSHLPKPVLRGTAKIVIKNLPIDYDAEDIVEALQEEGVEAVELYMFKNSHNSPTGTVKATVKGSNKMKEWLERGRGEIKGVRIGVERQRAPMTCFNCNKIGHRIAECKEAKKCKQCGQEGHLKAACDVSAEELAAKCNYCFDEGHRRGECQKKREDEREERHKHKTEKKDPVFENAWAKKPASDGANDHEKKNGSDNEMKKGWGDMKEEMEKEMKEQMEKFRSDLRNEVKEMLKDMMQEIMKNMMGQMKGMMKEAMGEVMHQQQQHNPLSGLKRRMATPNEQKGGRKKVDKEEVGGKNLEEELFGAQGMDEEDDEGRRGEEQKAKEDEEGRREKEKTLERARKSTAGKKGKK